MNSYNHYAYSAVAAWIYQYAAGVDATPLDAGFHTVVLHPVFSADLGEIAFDYDSRFGAIHSDWIVKGTTAQWNIILPANTNAWLPLNGSEAVNYDIEDVPLVKSKLAHAEDRGGEKRVCAAGWQLPANCGHQIGRPAVAVIPAENCTAPPSCSMPAEHRANPMRETADIIRS